MKRRLGTAGSCCPNSTNYDKFRREVLDAGYGEDLARDVPRKEWLLVLAAIRPSFLASVLDET